MSANPWHRRYHSDALAGMLSLTLEERGAYQTCLDLIYDRAGPIFDNDRLLSGYMGCSIRKWRSLRESLIAKGKLVAEDGMLTNFRAEKEIENDAKTRRKQAENGLKGARKVNETRKNSNKNNDDTPGSPQPPFGLPEARSQSIPLDKSNGPDSDPGKVFWDGAKAYLGKSKGGLIGKLAGEYTAEAVGEAITVAMLANPQPPDRTAYVIGILKRRERVRDEMPLC